MNQILTDVLGLFKRNKVVKTGKNGDLIPLADRRAGSLGISGPKPSEAMTLITAEDFAQNYVGTTLGVAPKFLRFQTKDRGPFLLSANYFGKVYTVNDFNTNLVPYQTIRIDYAWNQNNTTINYGDDIITGTTTAYDAGNPQIVTDTSADFVAAGVQVGDIFREKTNTLGKAFVISVDSPTQLTLGREGVLVGSGADYSIYRPDLALSLQKAINDALAKLYSNKNTDNIVDIDILVNSVSI